MFAYISEGLMESELLMRCGVDDRADDTRPCHLPLEFSTVFEPALTKDTLSRRTRRGGKTRVFLSVRRLNGVGGQNFTKNVLI